MKSRTNSAAGTSARAFLVVDADGERAEALRAELESRGFAVSVRRAKSAEEAAGPDAVPSEQELELLFRHLTKLEIKLLWALLRRAGRTISKQELYQEIYDGCGPIESRALDPLVRRLRRKLGPVGRGIETQRGVGVRWNPDPGERNGFPARRIFEALVPFRAAVLALLLVAAFSAGLLVRSGRGGEPAPVPAASEIPPPPPPVRAMPWGLDQSSAPEHGPECAIGSTNAPPGIRVGVDSGDGSGIRTLGEVDPATGLFSGDIGEKPALRVLLVVAADSDEPLAVRSVRVDP